ncbi:MAG: AraC family transcriptional regulator ligand-binding domain-containing protein, partial [Parahaliea sp.]
MRKKQDFGHHVLGFLPVLALMREMGFTEDQCLSGTGLKVENLQQAQTRKNFSLQSEYTLYRNILQLTGNPLFGLRISQQFPIESYGLLGYAVLSARTLEHALTIVHAYGALAYSVFEIDYHRDGKHGTITFSALADLPEDLLVFYCSRDLAGGMYSYESALKRQI